jgi:hypothetical protein
MDGDPSLKQKQELAVFQQVEKAGTLGIGHTERPSSEGAPESTLEMERGSTHLPLLQSVVDFCLPLGFRFASPQADIC